MQERRWFEEEEEDVGWAKEEGEQAGAERLKKGGAGRRAAISR